MSTLASGPPWRSDAWRREVDGPEMHLSLDSLSQHGLPQHGLEQGLAQHAPGGSWLTALCVASAGAAAIILVTYLVRRPPLEASTKLFLLLGLGVFPILAASLANVAGFRATQSRRFCGSCHVMIPHASDSDDRHSTSLAAVHAKNEFFGHDNCYTCHADYGMYGFVITKLGGMRHVWYYLTQYRQMPLEEAKHDIRIAKPLPNANCMECHTTAAPRWLRIADHAASLDAVRAGSVACASPGCHGYAHPMTKWGKELPTPQARVP